jgi:hypothetical protein
MGLIGDGNAFLYSVSALTSALALTTVIRRPRWLRGAQWRSRHPRGGRSSGFSAGSLPASCWQPIKERNRR